MLSHELSYEPTMVASQRKEGTLDVERASTADISELVDLRIAYLTEDNGALDAAVEEAIRSNLPGYYAAHLGKDLHAFVIHEGGQIVSCAFLIVQEKPMSPAFMSGKTGIVLNVYTRPEQRRRGHARKLIEALLADAKRLDLAVVELKATEDGYPLYQAVGFADDNSKYHQMKWVNR